MTMSYRPSPCFVIAEAGVNHGGNAKQAHALVDAAVAAGADAVKFQSFVPDKLVTRGATRAPYQRTLGSENDQHSLLAPLVLGRETEVELAQKCARVGIEFMSSPFDVASLRHLVVRCAMGRIKLGSGEVTHSALLLAVAQERKPLIVSTGMSTLEEVGAALDVLAFGLVHPGVTPSWAGCDGARLSREGACALRRFVTLLHCNSAYPTPPVDANVRAVDTLRSSFGLRVGYSDHTRGALAALAAVARGATVVEKHLTLDRAAEGPDHAASMTPTEFAGLVAAIRETEEIVGAGRKDVTSSERPQRAVARRSLVCTRPVVAGEVWTEAMITAKRPGQGLSPMQLWSLLGRVAQRSYAVDECVHAEELHVSLREVG